MKEIEKYCQHFSGLPITNRHHQRKNAARVGGAGKASNS